MTRHYYFTSRTVDITAGIAALIAASAILIPVALVVLTPFVG